MAGTLEYMAPEVLLKQPASQASDVYGLAIAINEIATGEAGCCGVLPGRRALDTAVLCCAPHCMTCGAALVAVWFTCSVAYMRCRHSCLCFLQDALEGSLVLLQMADWRGLLSVTGTFRCSLPVYFLVQCVHWSCLCAHPIIVRLPGRQILMPCCCSLFGLFHHCRCVPLF